MSSETYSNKLWEKIEKDVTESLKFFAKELASGENDIRESKLWDYLDKIAKNKGDAYLDKELENNSEWENFKEGNYTGIKGWLEGLEKLEIWAKKEAEKG
jgi:hypothetical protein